MLAAVVCLFALVVAATSQPVVLGSDNAPRPARPDKFNSPDELRAYLTQLSDFYASLGRPRFGKRLAPRGSRYPSDVFEQVFQYDE